MKAAIALAACSVIAAACTPAPAADIAHGTRSSGGGSEGTRGRVVSPRQADHSAAPSSSPDATTTEPATTTSEAPTTTVTVAASELAPVVHGEDFWYRLAMCESGVGRTSSNMFQFMGGTAEAVGYYPGASYEAQRAMAMDWAARIHPREGTTAGWPVCWWKAGGA